MRILTVDDEPVVQRWLRGLLKGHGRVDQAMDGVAALESFTRALDEDDPYDLAVMDIMMPGTDGLEATRSMVEIMENRGLPRERRTRIVMLSCLADPEHMLEAQYRCGADAYLTKPLERSTLEETLAAMGLAPNPVDQVNGDRSNGEADGSPGDRA